MIRSLVSTIFLAVLFVGCGDGTGPESGTQVTIAFTVGTSAAQTSGAQAAPSMVAAHGGDPVMGVNGTLTLTEVWMIVAEFELDGADDSCELDGGDDDCHDFEAPPQFLELPLEGGIVEVVAESEVPAGTYEELEFEVEDLEDDEDEEFALEIAELQEAILLQFPNWPEKASMRVEGELRLEDAQGDLGDPIAFCVYVEAEIEIEIEFDEVLTIPTGGEDPFITVDVRPDLWFALPGGEVLDLSSFDCVDPLELLEFEFELEADHHGIEIEIEIG